MEPWLVGFLQLRLLSAWPSAPPSHLPALRPALPHHVSTEFLGAPPPPRTARGAPLLPRSTAMPPPQPFPQGCPGLSPCCWGWWGWAPAPQQGRGGNTRGGGGGGSGSGHFSSTQLLVFPLLLPHPRTLPSPLPLGSSTEHTDHLDGSGANIFALLRPHLLCGKGVAPAWRWARAHPRQAGQLAAPRPGGPGARACSNNHYCHPAAPLPRPADPAPGNKTSSVGCAARPPPC